MSVAAIKRKAIIKYGTTFSMVVPTAVSGIKGRVSSNSGGDPVRIESVLDVEFAYDTPVVKGAILRDTDNAEYLVVALLGLRLKGEITHFTAQLYKCNASATIERKSLSAGVMGGVGTSSFSEIESDVPCFFVPSGYDANNPSIGFVAEGRFKVYLNGSYDLKYGDYLNIGGVRYVVRFIDLITFSGCFVCSVEEAR